jgi:hypothetical protein
MIIRQFLLNEGNLKSTSQSLGISPQVCRRQLAGQLRTISDRYRVNNSISYLRNHLGFIQSDLDYYTKKLLQDSSVRYRFVSPENLPVIPTMYLKRCIMADTGIMMPEDVFNKFFN